MHGKRLIGVVGLVLAISCVEAMEVAKLKDIVVLRDSLAQYICAHQDKTLGANPIPADCDILLGYTHCLLSPATSWQLLAEEFYLESHEDSENQEDVQGHKGTITCSAFVQGGSRALTAGADGNLYLWNTESYDLEKVIKAHSKRIHFLAVSRDESFIVTGSDDGTARIWRFDELTFVREFLHPEAVTSVAFSQNKSLIATGSTDGKVRIFTVEDGAFIKCYEHFPEDQKRVFCDVRMVRFLADDSVVIAGAGGIVKIWEREMGEVTTKGERTMTSFPCSMTSTQEGDVIWGHATGNIEVIDATGRPSKTMRLFQSGGVNSIALSQDGSLLVAGTSGQDVRADLWISHSLFGSESECELQPIRRFTGHTTCVKTVAISNDKSRILTGDLDGTLKLWSFRRLASKVGLEEAKWIASLPQIADQNGCVDVKRYQELYRNLDEDVKIALRVVYRFFPES